MVKDDSMPPRRRYLLTPDRLIAGLLIVEALLWLSDRLGWPAWHKGYAVLASIAALGVVLLLLSLWCAVGRLFRRRFQFSVRSLLVLVVAVAVPCSWLATEVKKARGQKWIIRSLALSDVTYDWCCNDDGYPMVRRRRQPPEPAWLRRLLGVDFFHNPVSIHVWDDADWKYVTQLPDWQRLEVDGIDDKGLEHLKGFGELRTLTISGGHMVSASDRQMSGSLGLQGLRLVPRDISDVGWQHLGTFTQLEELDLIDTLAPYACVRGLTRLRKLGLAQTSFFDEEDLRQLEGLTRLETLSLNYTPIGNEHLRELERLPQLRVLWLNGTSITDDGLLYLGGLPRLQILQLAENSITDRGLRYLRKLPDLRVLNLDNTKISDAGLQHLDCLAKLQVLSLADTKVSTRGIESLRKVLPNCRVNTEPYALLPVTAPPPGE